MKPGKLIKIISISCSTKSFRAHLLFDHHNKEQLNNYCLAKIELHIIIKLRIVNFEKGNKKQ